MNGLRFKIVTLFAPALLLLGCTYTWNINITEIGDYPLPLIEPLPINGNINENVPTYRHEFRD